MIRNIAMTVLIVGAAGLAGWAFVDQSRNADATTVAVDSGMAAPRGDRLDIAMPGRIASSETTPATRVQRAYAKIMADNVSSRFMTIAKPQGHQTTVLVKVPLDGQ